MALAKVERHLKKSGRDGTDSDAIKRMIGIASDPESVKKNRKLPGYRHDGSLFAIFAASFAHSSAPSFKVTVRPKTSQKVLSTLDEQRAELFVSGLADPELLLDRSGLVPTWCQTEIRRYVSGMSEPAGVSDSEHELKCCDRSHAANLTKSVRLWIAIVCSALNGLVQ